MVESQQKSCENNLHPLWNAGSSKAKSHCGKQEHDINIDDDAAFLAFLNDTVLNSCYAGLDSPQRLSGLQGLATAHGFDRAGVPDHNAAAEVGYEHRAMAAWEHPEQQQQQQQPKAQQPLPHQQHPDPKDKAARENGAAGAAAAAAVAAPLADRSPKKRPAGGDGNESGDARSVHTMPMPAKRRRPGADQGDSEVTSPDRTSDLVELPLFVGGSRKKSGACGGRGGGSGGPGGCVTAAAAREQEPPPGGTAVDNNAAAAAAAAAEAEDIFKAVLFSKVLTKSDASSKRIILPRIAIEANLPHLTAAAGGGAHGQGRAMQFEALDRAGHAWQLCIKAWANGTNPKPVYVLEGRAGELMKANKLGPGDVVGVLASQDGRYFVHWNTQQVREAAARPTFCAFEFQQHRAAREQEQQEAAAAAAQEQKGPAPGGAAAAAAARPKPQLVLPPAQHMTAVPVTSCASVPGMFTPTSPIEMLVMGPAPHDGAPGSPGGVCQLVLQSSGLLEFPDHLPFAPATLAAAPTVAAVSAAAPSGVMPAAGGGAPEASVASAGPATATGPAEVAAEQRAAPAEAAAAAATQDQQPQRPAAERVGGIVHQAGHLLCPRTPGCTRPAGHQGWCIGHRGANKRR